MIIRLIFIVITTLLSSSLLASTLTETTWQLSLPDSFPTINPITSDELPADSSSSSVGNTDPQTNSGEEYQTFEPGKEPPVTEWTLFPGLQSNVDKATLITCKTAAKFALQHLVAKGCSKGV